MAIIFFIFDIIVWEDLPSMFRESIGPFQIRWFNAPLLRPSDTWGTQGKPANTQGPMVLGIKVGSLIIHIVNPDPSATSLAPLLQFSIVMITCNLFYLFNERGRGYLI